MSDPTQQSTGKRIGHKTLLGLAYLAVLAWFVWLGLNMTGRNALESYEKKWEARGEHFALADFVPKPVPDDRNFALTPIVATSYESVLDKNGHHLHTRNSHVVDRLDMNVDASGVPLPYPSNGQDWLVPTPTNTGNWAMGETTDLKEIQAYFRKLSTRTNMFPVSAQAQSPAADVLLALSKYDGTIEELRQAAALPDSRFPLNYDAEPPADILLPHLAGLKASSQVLELRAVAELQNGQSDKALADVKLMLRLAQSIRSEPFLISHLVRIAAFNLALQPVWEGIRDHHWSDAQLEELNQELSGMDFLADYEFAMRGERALTMANIEYMRRTRNIFNGVNDDGEDSQPALVLHLIPSSVFYRNELAIAQAHQEWILPIVDVQRHSVSPEAAELAETNIEAMAATFSFNNIFARLVLSALERCPQRFGHAQSSADMARVACALERYRLAQGEYPETLDALAPRFIESLPPDVIGGQPLKYHRTSDGKFALYSMGWNGTDDGGRVFRRTGGITSALDFTKGDWVWSGQVVTDGNGQQ